MNANDLRNAILALTFINRDQFINAIFWHGYRDIEDARAYWNKFIFNPVSFYLTAPAEHREALSAMIQKHIDEGKTNG